MTEVDYDKLTTEIVDSFPDAVLNQTISFNSFYKRLTIMLPRLALTAVPNLSLMFYSKHNPNVFSLTVYVALIFLYCLMVTTIFDMGCTFWSLQSFQDYCSYGVCLASFLKTLFRLHYRPQADHKLHERLDSYITCSLMSSVLVSFFQMTTIGETNIEFYLKMIATFSSVYVCTSTSNTIGVEQIYLITSCAYSCVARFLPISITQRFFMVVFSANSVSTKQSLYLLLFRKNHSFYLHYLFSSYIFVVLAIVVQIINVYFLLSRIRFRDSDSQAAYTALTSSFIQNFKNSFLNSFKFYLDTNTACQLTTYFLLYAQGIEAPLCYLCFQLIVHFAATDYREFSRYFKVILENDIMDLNIGKFIDQV